MYYEAKIEGVSMKVTDKCCLFFCNFGVVVVVVVLRVKTGTLITVTFRLPFVQNSRNFFPRSKTYCSFEDI